MQTVSSLFWMLFVRETLLVARRSDSANRTRGSGERSNNSDNSDDLPLITYYQQSLTNELERTAYYERLLAGNLLRTLTNRVGRTSFH